MLVSKTPVEQGEAHWTKFDKQEQLISYLGKYFLNKKSNKFPILESISYLGNYFLIRRVLLTD